MRLTVRQRNDLDVAKKIIEQMLPNAIYRRKCLEILAESIKEVYRTEIGNWAVSLCPSGEMKVRLTVGMIFVYQIWPSRIVLTLDPFSQDRTRIQSYISQYDYDVLGYVASGGKDSVNNAPQFSSLPEAVWCNFQAPDIDIVYPLVQKSYQNLIHIACSTPLNPSVPQAHSPGVIKYVQASLSTSVPNPVYDIDQIITHLEQRLLHAQSDEEKRIIEDRLKKLRHKQKRQS